MLQGKISCTNGEVFFSKLNLCFQGDPVLKAKIQHLAASEAERDLHYHPFHDKNLQEEVERNKLCCSTVGSCYEELLNYAEQRIREIVHDADMKSSNSYSSSNTKISCNSVPHSRY